MTGTVIDAFVVELGLDPKKFTDGQREALESYKRTQEQVEKGAKNTEDASRRVGLSVGNVRTAAIQMFAAFSGGKGLVDFVTGLTQSNAELGRLQRSTDASARDISKWQGAARIFGGDAKSMAQSFVTITDAFAGWKVGVVSPLIADFRAISTAGGTVIDVNKSVNESLLDLADNLKAIHDKDRAQAGFLGRKIGLDPALFDILIRGRSGVQEVLNLMEKLGAATNKDVDAFGELEKRIGLMGVKADSLGRKLFGGQNGGASQVIQTADFINLTPSEAWAAASKQFKDEYAKSGFFGAWWNLATGKAASSTVASKKLFSNSKTVSGAFKSQEEKEAFIRAEAQKRGIDPNIAVAVAKSEGFKDYVGDKGTSFGSFQLHYKNNIPGLSNAGLGDEFTAKTGLHASDRSTEREQIQFALDQAKQGGWGPWHGWKGSRFAGIGQGGSTTNATNINGPITINAGPNADGTKIAQDFRDELLRRQGGAAQANYGQN